MLEVKNAVEVVVIFVKYNGLCGVLAKIGFKRFLNREMNNVHEFL